MVFALENKIGPRGVSCQSFDIRRVRFWNLNVSLLFENVEYYWGLVFTLLQAEAPNFGGFTKTLW